MQLDVPLVKQAKGSKDCGLAGIAMLMQYHGMKTSISEIRKSLKVDKVGTYTPQLGTFLLKNGFNVIIITAHPGLFTRNHYGMSSEDALKHFVGLRKKFKTPQSKKVINYFIEFLQNGGKIEVAIPTPIMVANEIAERRPIGALITSNYLLGNDPVFNFHFNIITGIDQQNVFVNDPLWDSRGGKKEYPIMDFFFGLYASSYGDLDNGSLFLVRKR
jgi:hypothetical protein